MIMELMPSPEKEQIDTITVQEIQCGDPACAPIDTMITVYWSEGNQDYPPETTKALAMPMTDVEKVHHKG